MEEANIEQSRSIIPFVHEALVRNVVVWDHYIKLNNSNMLMFRTVLQILNLTGTWK